MSAKLQFLYFGRLDDEKGFGAIIQMLQYFVRQQKKLPFVITVFWAGRYEREIKKLSHKDKNIHYFWFQSLDIIKQHAKQSDYILMPSLFLETFGLSALNALSRGMPVVGYKKWWLESFVLEDYNIAQFVGSSDKQLIAMIEKLLLGDSDYTKNKNTSLSVAKQYNFDEWFVRFQKIFGGPKKILLVTDFVQKLWGIETYIYDIAEELRLYGYTIRIVGSQWWQNRQSRLLSMVLSLCNVPFLFRLRSTICNFKPDIIWYHSVLRYVGWLPLAASGRLAKSYVMLHDLWYIHPYPHRVYEESAVLTSTGLVAFIRSARSRNPLVWIGVAVKWCMVRLLRRQFARMKSILVPSEFMKPLVSQWTKNIVQILPHFIQK